MKKITLKKIVNPAQEAKLVGVITLDDEGKIHLESGPGYDLASVVSVVTGRDGRPCTPENGAAFFDAVRYGTDFVGGRYVVDVSEDAKDDSNVRTGSNNAP